MGLESLYEPSTLQVVHEEQVVGSGSVRCVAVVVKESLF
jgi:hypothetical protein